MLDLLPLMTAPLAKRVMYGPYNDDCRTKFNEACRALEQGPPPGKDLVHMWPEAREAALLTLQKEKKDLGALTALCVSWLHTRSERDAAASFADLFGAVRAFLETCRDELIPVRDEDDDEGDYLDVRSAHIVTLDERMESALWLLPLWHGRAGKIRFDVLHASPEIAKMSLAEPELYTSVLCGAALPEKVSKALSEHDRLTLAAAAALSAEEAAAMYRAARAAEEALAALHETLIKLYDEECQNLTVPGKRPVKKTPPCLAKVQAKLMDRRIHARRLAELKGGLQENPEREPASEMGEAPTAEAAPAVARLTDGVFLAVSASREDAYRVITEAAALLRRVEPHSPAPLLLEKALTWGAMSFETLLREWIRDDGARQDVLRRMARREDAPEVSAPPSPPASTASVFSPEAGRDDAYRALSEAAALLRRLEPHSPAPLLLEKAVAWGAMSFETLLREWAGEEAAYRDVCRHVWLAPSS